MKILVQSDDYGFTKGVVAGMCDAFENGLITATGLFANMPIAAYAVERIKQYPQICLGIDINVSSGPCVADPAQLPTLVDQATGCFIPTSVRVRDPRWGQDVFKPYEEVVIEASAQIETFIRLTGRKPEYLQTHSTSGSKQYLRALRDVAHQYGIPFSLEVYQAYGIQLLMKQPAGDPWSYENQTVDKVEQMLELLEENQDKEYVCMPSHCGFVDHDLMVLSRCNLSRAYDHAYLVSPRIKQWIQDHGAQRISYRDLPMPPVPFKTSQPD